MCLNYDRKHESPDSLLISPSFRRRPKPPTNVVIRLFKNRAAPSYVYPYTRPTLAATVGAAVDREPAEPGRAVAPALARRRKPSAEALRAQRNADAAAQGKLGIERLRTRHLMLKVVVD